MEKITIDHTMIEKEGDEVVGQFFEEGENKEKNRREAKLLKKKGGCLCPEMKGIGTVMFGLQ